MASNKLIANNASEAWLPMSNRERRFAEKDLIYGTNRHLGICETLRLIYDEAIQMKDSKRKEIIIRRLVDALLMVKKMAGRLAYYKKTYSDGTGNSGKNLIYILDSKKRRDMRWARKQ